MNPRLIASLLLTISLAVGCSKSSSAPAAATTTDPTEPRAAQPKLQTIKLWLGTAELDAELAVTMQEMRTGMMFRTNMLEIEGMLFAFGIPHRTSFWMKNTFVPLSAAYISPDGVIREIHDLQPQDTNSVTAASDNIQFVLETPQGWFNRHGVGTGAVVRTDHGSLIDMFRGK